jgi:hypothetical protein
LTAFLLTLAVALGLNLASAVLLRHFGLQTGLWDLHFWAIWPSGHAPEWMPVNDSWMPMRKAYDWFRAPHQGTLYQEIFFRQHVKFQYPPSSLLLFAIPDAFHVTLTDRLLNWIGWFAVLAEAIATAALAYVAAARTSLARPNRLIIAAACGVAAFSFHSVLWAFSLGQIQAWLNAAFALAALAFLTGRERTAGALIGVICLIKPQFGLFALWAAFRGKGPFLWGLLIAVGIGLVLSLLKFGLANHFDYLSAISFMNQHGEAYYPNSAVNGVMNRLVGNDDPFTVDKTAFPPFNPLVYYVSVITSVALVAVALFHRRARGLADFFVAGIVFTIASPIAWVHHLGILPPVFAFLAVTAIEAPVRVRAAVLLVLAYLLSATFIPPVAPLASGIGSLAYAMPLVGALVLVTMMLMRSRAAE